MLFKYTQPETLKQNLYPYQLEGYNWILNTLIDKNLSGCLLADDMGLGKTNQAIAVVTHLVDIKKISKKKKALIIVPKTVINVWSNRFKELVPNIEIQIFTPKLNIKKSTAFVILTTYNMIASRDETSTFNFYKFLTILDEGQYIKNPESKRAKAIKKLQSDKKLILTGTPFENSINDLFSLYDFICPSVLNEYFINSLNSTVKDLQKKQEDKQTHEIIEIQYKGSTISSDKVFKEKDIAEFASLIQPYTLRRIKNKNTIKLLPIEYKRIYCEFAPLQNNNYQTLMVRGATISEMAKRTRTARARSTKSKLALGIYSKLLSICGATYETYKFNEVYNILKEIPKEDKVIIFISTLINIEYYKRHLEKTLGIESVHLEGKHSKEERKDIIAHFRTSSNIKLIIISIKMGAMGIDLLEANHVIILNTQWNPALDMQAIGRAHRNGQLKKVFAYFIIAQNSLESRIYERKDLKIKIGKELLDCMPSKYSPRKEKKSRSKSKKAKTKSNNDIR